MSVHYKFKSNLDHDTVTFDGLNISVADLKKSIMQQKKIGKSSDFDLQITNAQTKEVYDNDDMLVPKNTSVIVARVPVQGGTKKNWDKPDLPLPIDDDDMGHIRYDRIVKNADLVNANTSEEDKVKAMITQSSQEYDPSKYVKSRSMTGPLPPSYTCFRCGKQGHWIKNCPTNNPDVKRSTGIPRSFMVPVDGPEHKGALLTSSGDYAVPLIDHQAYKEVKKEKPPFVPQDEPVVEPEAEVPEELLCMVCKDLLQDAVLIPCCGNSFCDECVRQVLLESENHECPICHEINVSPNTLIPNRFLRTAVLNYKNETGYTTRIRKAAFMKSPPTQRVDSPQPSPDSTVENQSHGTDNSATQLDCSPKNSELKKDATDLDLTVKKEDDENFSTSGNHTPENTTPKGVVEEDSDAQPGTPLADEPPNDGIGQNLPIQTIGQEQYNTDRYDYHSSSKYSRNHRDDYRRHHYEDDSHEPRPISTIETITNTRKNKFGRLGPVRQHFPEQRSHRDDRSDHYYHERDDYHSRYDKRHTNERGSRRTGHYDKSSRDSRYTSSSAVDYSHPEHENDYELPVRSEDTLHRHQDRYHSPPPHPVLIPPVPTMFAAPVPAIPPPHPALLPTPQVFPPQPPPPGASPINTSHIASQPPPPGVGPLLPISTDSGAFVPRTFESEDPLKDMTIPNERSIDDRMEEFQRKLEKRQRYSRERGSRSRSSERHRSRSSSRSRTYSSSKSWTRSPSRSSHRSSRSRSQTPFSSRSRSRSYSHSRSRSWSKKRSYTRSRSRTRTDSRSRSRSRAESSIRRRGNDSRDRVRSPISRGRSRSYSPKGYRVSSHRNLSYSNKHSYTPPQYTSGVSFQSQYGPPPTILPLTVVRPPTFPPHHLHSMPPPIQPIHSRPVEQYSIERQPKYPFGDQYSVYDTLPPKYPHQRYERDQRVGEHRVIRYDKRSEYQRHQEEVPHRIPGYIGERSRDYKSRYRQTRDPQRKEIRELPQISESDMRIIHSKESSAESSSKKKDEKLSAKHKKHHHHHKSKEVKKQDNKIPVMVSGDKQTESTKNLISVELSTEKDKEKNNPNESDSKTTKSVEKVKDKKHKHKKHKMADQPLKKKKSAKKEKAEGAPSTDTDLPTKTKVKKKKMKLKTIEEEKTTETAPKEIEQFPIPELQTKIVETLVSKDTTVEENVKPNEDPDVLDIFADDPEAADLNAELNPECNTADLENVATDNLELVETENVEISGNSEEEEVEETVEDENVLHVDMPGISKWEREESEDEDTDLLQHRSSVVAPKDEKGTLPSDIISRAENVLLAKQFKPRIDRKDTSDSKNSSDVSSPEHSSSKHKETLELKSVVNSEQLKPDTLHVTISNSKEKRSVYSRKDDTTKNSKVETVSKRDRFDRSNRHSHLDDNNTRRTVAVHSARNERERIPDRSDRRERRHTPSREVGRNSSRDRRDYSRKERDHADDAYPREERKRRFDDYYGGSSSRTGSRDHSDRRRPATVTSSSRCRKPYERDFAHHSEREKQESRKRSRSKSHDSGGSHHSYKKKSDRKYNESTEEHRSQKINKDRVHLEEKEPPRRKHSPIKAPDSNANLSKITRRNYEDELKFEPDYDDFSEEERSRESKDRQKRKVSSPEGSRKVAKMERTVKIDSSVKVPKADKSSVTSSVSSSAASESDSSDSDDQRSSKNKNSDSDYKQKHKKSKHKKHKKHKHKHKKKKSHKSKKD